MDVLCWTCGRAVLTVWKCCCVDVDVSNVDVFDVDVLDVDVLDGDALDVDVLDVL